MRPEHAGTILIVDDEPANREVLSRLMARLGYEATTAENGIEALDAVLLSAPDVVLLDVNMPGIDGIEVCRLLKTDPATCLIPIILVTAQSQERVRGKQAGADDFLAKPPDFAELEARVSSLIRLKRYTDELDSAEGVILSLALTIEARDPYTNNHCQRLALYAVALGNRLGLSERELTALQRGAYLKPGKLTPEEYALMQQHTTIGDRLCSELRLLADVRPIVRHHHERPNGTGYPDGLTGEAIPLLARILAVVDVYDALTTERPYKRAFTPDEAVEELRAEVTRGWKFAELVETFAVLVAEGDFEKYIRPGPLRFGAFEPVKR
jgi:putative two-component system response regulator